MAGPVANPLTLVMDIKSEQDFHSLVTLLNDIQGKPPEQNLIRVALRKIGTVHFARFVFFGKTQLAVITTYDGDFEEYINAFTNDIGKVFDALLLHMKDAPPLPVANNRDAFLKYVKDHDIPCVPPFYSAYPSLKTQDIIAIAANAGMDP